MNTSSLSASPLIWIKHKDPRVEAEKQQSRLGETTIMKIKLHFERRMVSAALYFTFTIVISIKSAFMETPSQRQLRSTGRSGCGAGRLLWRVDEMSRTVPHETPRSQNKRFRKRKKDSKKRLKAKFTIMTWAFSLNFPTFTDSIFAECAQSVQNKTKCIWNVNYLSECTVHFQIP